MSSSATGRPAVDYDRIAPTYDERYGDNARTGTQVALQAVVRDRAERLGRAPRVLESGCGTGKWLADLAEAGGEAYGLDASAGMLEQAWQRPARLRLVQGRAGQLPYAARSFDLVYAVNAIHHFGSPRGFISEARRLLRPVGKLAVVGMDPHGHKERWYGYRYFKGAYETDLARFPSWQQVQEWMAEEGLRGLSCREVERYSGTFVGRAVLDDPFLRKHASSQLALLSEDAYRTGLRRIKDALAHAEARGETLTFTVDTPLAMIVGHT
jgi:ubiquinone/menaquinone biosynthesis C-methylase UbiE